MPFLHLEISDDLHRRIRVEAATKGLTIKQYVTEALERATTDDQGSTKRRR